MSERLAQWAAAKGAAQAKEPASDGPRWNAQERAALRKLRREAKAAGATLATGGEGGLPPSLVLGIFRRDGFKCLRCGRQEMIGLHHKSEHMNDPKAKQRSQFLRERGRVDSPANLVTVCEKKADGSPGCHDKIHERDREEHA